MEITGEKLKSGISVIKNAVEKDSSISIPNFRDSGKGLTELTTEHFSSVVAGIKKGKVFTPFDFHKMFQGKFVTPGEFYILVQTQNITHIVNPQLGHELLQNPKTMQTIDKLAKALRQADGTYRFSHPVDKPGATFVGTSEINLPKLEFHNGVSELAVHKKLGTGVFGNAYEVSIGDKKYALKVFTDPNRVDVNGAIGEISYQLSMTNKGISNKTELYAANAKNGWMLTELSNKEHYDLSQRGKRTISEYLGDVGLNCDDLCGPNTEKGLVVDIGGIYGEIGKTKVLSEFQDKYKNPYTSMTAGRDALTEKQFMECFHHPESRAQVARATRNMADSELRYKLLDKALNYKESAATAIFETPEAHSDMRFHLYKKALTIPESRIEAAKIIDSINEKNRYQAFLEAWRFPECRPMLGKSVHTFTQPKQQDQIFNLIINSNDPGAKLSCLSIKQGNGDGLTGAEQVLKDVSLRQYFEGHGLHLKGNG